MSATLNWQPNRPNSLRVCIGGACQSSEMAAVLNLFSFVFNMLFLPTFLCSRVNDTMFKCLESASVKSLVTHVTHHSTLPVPSQRRQQHNTLTTLSHHNLHAISTKLTFADFVYVSSSSVTPKQVYCYLIKNQSKSPTNMLSSHSNAL